MRDIEGVAEALAIELYETVNDDANKRTPWNHLPPGECENWRRASNKVRQIASEANTFVPGSSPELNAIHAVVMSIGSDWPEVDSDPYTLWHVKRMARELKAMRESRVIGYLPHNELSRIRSGHDARMRSARFGPSALDGDVPVYLAQTAGSLK